MNANYVEQHQIVDRYLLGKLSEQEAEEFEILCLHDQQVLDQLELSEKMLAGFHRADEQNLLREVEWRRPVKNAAGLPPQQRSADSYGAARARPFPGWNFATAATLFLGICLVSTVTVFSQRDIPASVYEPQINTPVIPLARTRSASAQPDQTVYISSQPQWMVLQMDLSQAQHDSYRATLLDRDQNVVWQSDGLEKNYWDEVTLSLNSARLAEGNYLVKIEGLTGTDTSVRVGEYAFKVQLREQPSP